MTKPKTLWRSTDKFGNRLNGAICSRPETETRSDTLERRGDKVKVPDIPERAGRGSFVIASPEPYERVKEPNGTKRKSLTAGKTAMEG